MRKLVFRPAFGCTIFNFNGKKWPAIKSKCTFLNDPLLFMRNSLTFLSREINASNFIISIRMAKRANDKNQIFQRRAIVQPVL